MKGKETARRAEASQRKQTGAEGGARVEMATVSKTTETTTARYYLIESTVLGDTFVLCTDKKLLKQVRQKFPGVTIYFLQEMEEVMALEDHMEREEWCDYVRAVHKVKKMSKGWIIPGQVAKVEKE